MALFVSACVLLLCGCTAAGVGGTDSSKETPAAKMQPAAVSGAAGPRERLAALEDVRASVTADFDGDGREEAFALTGREVDGQLEGELWYVTETGEERFSAVSGDGGAVACFTGTAREIQAGSKRFALFESGYAVETGTVLLGVREGKPYQAPVYGMGFGPDGGDFVLWQSALDASVMDGIPAGRTEKPYRLYWDEAEEAFREYGAVEIDRALLEGLAGGPELLAEIGEVIEQESGVWGETLYRGDGTVILNYRINAGENELGAYGENRYLTLTLEGKTLTRAESGEGSYLKALLPELAVYPAAPAF